ncbi:hypothetical protein BT96DRAFT_979822 [Gymnopus androsaceus JB14]|uniref:Zn(2)-C6 fungal-type domain-containing protein n=1 Tax=Gymnopus androsaceus JB14 TaxID=1447944 RepID=A0A6A4H1A9_9AGAR|nr:hypothetical protein BT96DRAFT_979822 [Gymnopus androsaceus JB14]
MSTNTAAKQQRAQPPSRTQPSTKGHDGKRRRNRAILSCLSCHGSKRMCDRKRPTCARCTELGLFCIYEVDDPNQRLNTQDRSSRLLKRAAELEGEIEEVRFEPFGPGPERHRLTITRRGLPQRRESS